MNLVNAVNILSAEGEFGKDELMSSETMLTRGSMLQLYGMKCRSLDV